MKWSRNFRDPIDDSDSDSDVSDEHPPQQSQCLAKSSPEAFELSQDEKELRILDLGRRDEAGIVIKENPWRVCILGSAGNMLRRVLGRTQTVDDAYSSS